MGILKASLLLFLRSYQGVVAYRELIYSLLVVSP
jgi:hypothetical protein